MKFVYNTDRLYLTIQNQKNIQTIILISQSDSRNKEQNKQLIAKCPNNYRQRYFVENNKAKQYESPDFKMLYTYIKGLNLINQLYLTEAMDRKQFEEEQKDILSRYQKVKQQIKNHNKNVDFERFAQIYGIEAEYKRIQSDPKTQEDKKIIQVAILLTSKLTECFDTIHQSKLVKDLINIVTQIDMLLKKLKTNAHKISAQFQSSMNKITAIKQSMKTKNIHEELSTMEMFELQDSIMKIKIHFQQFSSL